jgi:hypothetical protein
MASSECAGMNLKLDVRVLTLVLASCIRLAVVTSSAWFDTHAQDTRAPTGYRQPKAGDIQTDPSRKDTPRSPEDIALERALNNICRGCSPIIPVHNVPRYNIARTCPAGESSDRCREDEETVGQKLTEQWATFT